MNLRANAKAGFRSILHQYLRPAFGSFPLARIRRAANEAAPEMRIATVDQVAAIAGRMPPLARI